MAAAEARAAWQRTANRCFMQEDAKRAPKLACCPGAPPSKSQSDSSHSEAGNAADQSSAAISPVNWNACANLSPETRWWLQRQPSFGSQRYFTCEQLADVKCETDDVEMDCEFPRSSDWPGHEDRHDDSFLDGSVVQRLSGGDSNTLKNKKNSFRTADDKDIGLKDRLDGQNGMEDPISSCQDDDWTISKIEDLTMLEGYEKYAHEMTTDKSGDKGGLWWRTADENELAMLVAQKSSHHIENCDLPPPQFMRIRKGSPSGDKLCYGDFSESIVRYEEGFSDSTGHSISPSFSKASNHMSPFSVCKNLDAVPLLSVESHYPTVIVGEKASSSGSTNRTWSESRQSFESDGDKAQLLQALCHSQTRAREAEVAAARAFSEKEQLVRLFLKEASHLFAYRQWLQLLQIETLCLKIKAKDQSVSLDQLKALFPLFPWMPLKHQRWAASNTRSNKRHKVGQQNFDISTWALAVALGLSLAGAGLFLGWSMGWLLPMF